MSNDIKRSRSSTGRRKSLGVPNGPIDNWHGILAIMKESHKKALKCLPQNVHQDSLDLAVSEELSEIARDVARNTVFSETPSDNLNVKEKVRKKEETWKTLTKTEIKLENIDWTTKIDLSSENKSFIDKASNIEVQDSLKTSSLNKAYDTLCENLSSIESVYKKNTEKTNTICDQIHHLLFRDVNQILTEVFSFDDVSSN